MKYYLKPMKMKAAIFITALPLSVFAQEVMMYPAQDLMIYPTKGQTAEQIAKDRSECQTWAVQQTGFDPISGTSASQSTTQTGGVGRNTLRGGARGAAAGAAIGAIAGDAGKGAAIGAAAGGMKGLFQQRDANKKAQAGQANEARNNYNRALSACLSGRGYSVQ